MYVFILLILLNCFIYPVKAVTNRNFDFNLGFPFGENAVLQREEDIKIFGTAKPDSLIELNLAKQKSATQTNKEGEWLILLKPMKAGGPYKLKVTDQQKTIEIKNIYVGDVWLSAGQSNMVWFVDSATNAEKNIAEANKYTNKIFFLDPNLRTKEEPASPFVSSNIAWLNTTSQAVKTFPAVPYAFSREIYKDQKVPIGIIQTAVSNTKIQAHMSKESLVDYKDLEKFKAEALEDRIVWFQSIFLLELPREEMGKYFFACMGDPKHQNDITVFINDRKVLNDFFAANCNKLETAFLDEANKIQIRVYPNKLKDTSLDEIATGLKESKIILNGERLILDNWQTASEIGANNPGLNFNTKINPVTLYPIKGVLWYQGESNINDYDSYKELFSRLVKDWRDKWQINLPFITVQLHNFKTEPQQNLQKFRKVQKELSMNIPKIYMIDVFDLSDPDLNVHPRNKDEVGHRLAEMAKKKIYN